MKRIVMSLVASAVLGASLTACGGGGSAEEFCGLEDDFQALESMDDLDAARGALDDAVDAAPDEIKDDVETVANAAGEFFDKIDELGIDLSDPSTMTDLDPEQIEEITAIGEEMQSGEVGEASQRVEDWVAENCESS